MNTNLKLHNLRHTDDAFLAVRGTRLRRLKELLGPQKLAMTQRYSHPAPEYLKNAVKLLEGVINY